MKQYDMKTASYIIVMILLLGTLSCKDGEETQSTEASRSKLTEETMEGASEITEESPKNIFEIVNEDETFSTLKTAVSTADLTEVLTGKGPFTVFAPTNAAFSKIPNATLNSLLEPSGKGVLTGIITYHILPGKFDTSQLIEAINSNNGNYNITTVQGEALSFSLMEGNVFITDITGASALVIAPDIMATNGLIHAIDAVVMPE